MRDLFIFMMEIHRPLVGTMRSLYVVLEPSLSFLVPVHYMQIAKAALSSQEEYDLLIKKLKNVS